MQRLYAQWQASNKCEHFERARRSSISQHKRIINLNERRADTQSSHTHARVGVWGFMCVGRVWCAVSCVWGCVVLRELLWFLILLRVVL